MKVGMSRSQDDDLWNCQDDDLWNSLNRRRRLTKPIGACSSIICLLCICHIAEATPTTIFNQSDSPASITKCTASISGPLTSGNRHTYTQKIAIQLHNRSQKAIAYARVEAIERTKDEEPVNILFQTFGSLNGDASRGSGVGRPLEPDAFSSIETNSTSETVDVNSTDDISFAAVTDVTCKLVFIQTYPLSDPESNWSSEP